MIPGLALVSPYLENGVLCARIIQPPQYIPPFFPGAAPKSNLFYGLGAGSVFTVEVNGDTASIIGQANNAAFTGAADVTSDSQGKIYVRTLEASWCHQSSLTLTCLLSPSILPPTIGDSRQRGLRDPGGCELSPDPGRHHASGPEKHLRHLPCGLLHEY